MDKFYLIDMRLKTVSSLVTGEIKLNARSAKKSAQISNPARVTGNGYVAVPIYGALRSYAEKIYKEAGDKICDTGSKGAKGCGNCILCNLFGSLGRRGRMIIDDLVSNDPAKSIVDVVFHSRIDRTDKSVTDSLQIEEVKEGAIFTGQIRIIDPKEDDLAILNTAIKAINDFGIGGWLKRGRGRVEMTIDSVEEMKWSDYKKVGKEEAVKLLS